MPPRFSFKTDLTSSVNAPLDIHLGLTSHALVSKTTETGVDSLYSVTRRQENRGMGDRCSIGEAKANESFTPLMPPAPTPFFAIFFPIVMFFGDMCCGDFICPDDKR